MNLEDKKEKVMDALDEIYWGDDNIEEIMSGFFNSPIEAIDKSDGEMSEDHVNSLFDLLDIKEDEE